MCFRLIPKSVTLKGAMALILRYFAEFGSFPGPLRRSLSGDKIANVNFLYDDIVHVLQNTIETRALSPPQVDAVLCWNAGLPNSVK